MKTVGIGIVAAMLLVGTMETQAAVLAQYNLTVATSTATDAADAEGANLTAGDFQVFVNGALSVDFTASGAGISGISDNAFISRGLTDTEITASTDDYFTFTVTPDSGFGMTLSNLTFDFITGTSSAGYTNQVRSSVDGFTTSLGETAQLGGNTTAVDLDLSSLGELTAATEFRFLFKDNVGGSTIITRIDNVVLNGTVAARPEGVPEPATLALTMLGLLGIRKIRRVVIQTSKI